MEVFIYLLIIFAIILVGLRLKIDLGLTLIGASLFVGLFFLVNPWKILSVFGATIIEKDKSGSFVTLELIVILFLISFLEIVMRRSGAFDRLLGSIGFLIKDRRKVTAFFPIFLGTLPSAGGARFSAPLTEKASEDLNLSAERKSFINYWFRHIWEPVFPLYPGIIFAATLAHVALGDLNKYQSVYFFFMLVLGWFIAFRGVPKLVKHADTDKNTGQHILSLAEGIFPVIFIIIAVLFFRQPLLFSLFIVVVAQLFIYQISGKILVKHLREAFSFNIVMMITGVMFFKNMLEVSGAIDRIVVFFAVIKLPLTILLFSMPFVIGLLTGVVQAFVAITFPLLIPLITIEGTVSLPMLSFAFMSGYFGVLLSPVHLCYLLTCEYFKTDINRIYKYLLIAIPVMLGMGLLILKIKQ
ncbi:MAG: DUF401 family protein [Candidatus Firestonebacteria bacterium]